MLSGDVHFGHYNQLPCRAHVGYKVLEYTSSGLSHSVASFFAFLSDWSNASLDTIYSPDWVVSDLNYGEITVNTSNSLLSLSIRSLSTAHFQKVINLTSSDFTFNRSATLLNREFCLHI